MSLYNQLFGVNHAAPFLLALLNLDGEDGQYPTGRFRDIYPAEGGETIILYTRNGGGNREDYQGMIDVLRTHPNFLRDHDDDFDCTYAYFEFSVPEAGKDAVKMLTAPEPPRERWNALLEGLRKGDQNDPTVKRALGVGEQIFQKISEGQTKIEV